MSSLVYPPSPIICHDCYVVSLPGYPLLDFQSLRSRSSAGLGITFPDLFDTRTFSPSSVYMYLILHGLLVESQKSNITRNRGWKYQHKGINSRVLLMDKPISHVSISGMYRKHWYEARARKNGQME